jgi:hypothetical protein
VVRPELLLTPVEVEGGSSVEDNLDPRDLDDFIEGIDLGNIGHDHDIELLFCLVRVGFPDLLGLGLGTYSRHNTVALLKELLKNMSGDEAGSAWVVCKRLASLQRHGCRSSEVLPVRSTLVILFDIWSSGSRDEVQL